MYSSTVYSLVLVAWWMVLGMGVPVEKYQAPVLPPTGPPPPPPSSMPEVPLVPPPAPKKYHLPKKHAKRKGKRKGRQRKEER